jgi:propanol-preferring alcohol dehydrogenase
LRAQVLHRAAPIDHAPLTLEERALPVPGRHQARVRVRACACCRTDLHVVEGDLDLPVLPIVPGHQVVGVVDALGDACARLAVGQRVGVAWLHETDGTCEFCRRGEENLCVTARFTGWTADGGYADAVLVPEDFAVDLPPDIDDIEVAPLLCAGVIGYRALRKAEVHPGERVALFGFGASAHLMIQVLRHWDCDVSVLTRGAHSQALARELGATWVGDATTLPPQPCDRAIIFAPAGELVPTALDTVRPGGTVVSAGIHMSPIPQFDYEHLWHERTLSSVANTTRAAADEFLSLVSEANIRAHTDVFSLQEANRALRELKEGRLRGAAVLQIADN